MPRKKRIRPYHEVALDLTRTDTYQACNIPDEAVECCLKVLRTLRHACATRLDDKEGAALLTQAHVKVTVLSHCARTKRVRSHTGKNGDSKPDFPTEPDPDQMV